MDFESKVKEYWMNRLKCSKPFKRDGVCIVSEFSFNEKNKCVIYQLNGLSIIRIAEKIVEKLNLSSCDFNHNKAFIQELQNKGWKMDKSNDLLDYFLNEANFKEQLLFSPYSSRQLHRNRDKDLLFQLFDSCSDSDLDAADIYVNELDPIIVGIFDNETLIAYASYYYWDDLMCDIGVLVHPKYRGKRLSEIVVSKVCEIAIKENKIPMYRVFENHIVSKSIPERLGFQMMVKVESFTLTSTNN